MMMENTIQSTTSPLKKSAPLWRAEEVLEDFKVCCYSREASMLGRKEVLTGKAKFGIVGDGKELPQVAMAKAMQAGDWRSGYYRDQTLMFSLGISTLEQFFAQLYADANNDPFSGGRQMNNHFATPMVNEKGEWLDQLVQVNVSSDISSTGGQMARGLGLAMASKQHRGLSESVNKGFSSFGNEVAFVTIGDASTSEGVFWESVNAAAVMQVPMVVAVWDDGYGISVPTELQTAKGSISEALQGMDIQKVGQKGIKIFRVKGWDYAALRNTFAEAAELARTKHIPCLVHVQEVTQPQGHSTSGSHERYKSESRLIWEKEQDCIEKFKTWILENDLATSEKLESIRTEAIKAARTAKANAWKAYNNVNVESHKEVIEQISVLALALPVNDKVQQVKEGVNKLFSPVLAELVQWVRRLQYATIGVEHPSKTVLMEWLNQTNSKAQDDYHTHLYSNSPLAAIKVPSIAPIFSVNSEVKNGYEVLNAFFDHILGADERVLAFGEDVGQIGGVNQAFAGMQEKYGAHRVFDTGIREWTIMGQAIGLAMRGLRPIAEIQYLDYLIYGLEPLHDDLATLRYRSDGIQQAPVIVRTRGHRLEGIWHSGSPMGMMLNTLQGMYICVPRNMVQAAGMYNTLLKGDDPAIVVECLNGYRLKETMPDNIGTYTIPLGSPEILQHGTDLTLVTYGSCVRVAQEAVEMLHMYGIHVELIDVQTLLPFDIDQTIVHSLKKTNRIIFLDEDIPGGATSFMMQQVIEKQGGYRYLDSEPLTISAHAHRTPFGSDGDYYTKPNPEDVFEAIYAMMADVEPSKFPSI